jgi:murein DD-endopeptidase MepM/ murein hydrolase activator NlpD
VQIPLLRNLPRRALVLVGIALVVAGCVTPAPAPAPWTGAGDIPCPVTGSVHFTNDYGDPRSGGRRHEGIDIFAPRGRTNVAVVNGTIAHRFDPAGGNTIWLTDKNGHRYVYLHLDRFAGAPRAVTAGEVIGYSGDTGNAFGVHTHLEIRPNGGASINPYGTLLEACPNRT